MSGMTEEMKSTDERYDRRDDIHRLSQVKSRDRANTVHGKRIKMKFMMRLALNQS